MSASNEAELRRQAFGEVVRRLRIEAGLSRSQLAQRAPKLSEGYLAKIEQGARTPSPPLLAQLAEALGTDARNLLTEAEERADAIAEQVGRAEEEGVPSGARRTARPSSRPVSWPRRISASRGPGPGTPVEVPRWLRDLRVAVEPAAVAGDLEIIDHLERFARRLVSSRPSWERLELLERLEGLGLSSEAELDQLEAGLDLTLAAFATAETALSEQEFRRLLDYALVLARSSQPLKPMQRVATLPPGTDAYVFANAVGRDEEGGIWLDPLAPARELGLPAQDPVVRRLADGRVFVDLHQLRGVDLPARDPQRHRLKAAPTRALSDAAIPLDVYESTRLEIRWSDEVTIEVARAPLGTTEGEFPASVATVHVVTASNPAPDVLPAEENARRNERLKADLQRAALAWRPAIGRSSNPHEPWAEHGFALVDVGRDRAVDLGRRYEQNSIFEWTPEHRALVLCRHPDNPQDEAVLVHGWSATWR